MSDGDSQKKSDDGGVYKRYKSEAVHSEYRAISKDFDHASAQYQQYSIAYKALDFLLIGGIAAGYIWGLKKQTGTSAAMGYFAASGGILARMTYKPSEMAEKHQERSYRLKGISARAEHDWKVKRAFDPNLTLDTLSEEQRKLRVEHPEVGPAPPTAGPL